MERDRGNLDPINLQVEYLWEALEKNAVVQALLEVAAGMSLPAWYLGASGVSQTVWNLKHGFDPGSGITDYDLVYFDAEDLSDESRRCVEADVARRVSDFGVTVDVHNEARVHLWYARRFGKEIEPYRSTEDAISTWPTTASAVAVRRDSAGSTVFAPFGLSDLFGMVARPNKAIVSRDVYEEKVARWSARWPLLRVIPWGQVGGRRTSRPTRL